jgi:NAD(P)-dependent dehydrogenase (short-subunit alcohol dehydrogenase family)
MQKTVLITGVNGNLGQAVAEKFYHEGYAILGTARTDKPLQYISTSAVDLTDETAVEHYINKIKSPALNVAVLTVGAYAGGDLLSTDKASLQKMFALNFDTAYFVVRALLPHFESIGGGHFVLIGSQAAFEASAALHNVAYGLSKAATVTLANIVNEYGKDKNIRCSVIVPSTIDTPQNRTAMADADFGAWTTPEAIAETIYFLFTPSGSHLRETVLKMYNEA